jgi:hypothetical protein
MPSKTLNAKFHAYLSEKKLTANRAAIIAGYTDGRTDSAADLTDDEVKGLLQALEKTYGPSSYQSNKPSEPKPEERRKKMQFSIIAMAHEMGWQLPPSEPGGKKRVDMERLNRWCKEKSYLKKPLNDYEYDELIKLVNQFSQFKKKN